MMAHNIRILIVTFDVKIQLKEIPLFRGAILRSMGKQANLLYHNHTGDTTYRYSYPLIQYKRLFGNAAIVCVKEGADVIGQFLTKTNKEISIGKRVVNCIPIKVLPSKIFIRTWDHSFHYHIHRWLPLNAKNYKIYQMLEDETEKKYLLMNVLKGNLLSLLKGLNIHIEDEIQLEITEISEPYIVYNKGIALMAFNADFSCNLTIPDKIGIGKNSSIGFGTVRFKQNA